jgi:hypothetical protein
MLRGDAKDDPKKRVVRYDLKNNNQYEPPELIQMRARVRKICSGTDPYGGSPMMQSTLKSGTLEESALRLRHG